MAVFAGIVISTAVLTGALIIGDSVKLSLKHLVDTRLGNVKYALLSNDRFVRSQLANDISEELNTAAAALMILEGIAVDPETGIRINSVKVNGVDDRFWSLSEIEIPSPGTDEAIINVNLAQKLNVKVGDEFLLRVDRPGKIPMNSLFIEDDKSSVAIRLVVKAIADDNQLGRFSLKSNQAIPDNIFVSLNFLSSEVDLESYANTILVAEGPKQKMTLEKLDQCLRDNWEITDASLKIRDLQDHAEYEILSDRIFIDRQIIQAIQNTGYKAEYLITYLVNSIRSGENQTPYSFVTAASFSELSSDLKENEIVINDWLSDDLNATIGDTISLEYYVIGPFRKLETESKHFVVKRIIPVSSDDIDSTLMPDFPGLADAGSCKEWNTSIPVHLDRIRDKDELYWDLYQGTPKAIIPLQTGINMWGNDYGNYTAVRIDRNHITPDELGHKILSETDPENLRLLFIPVYEQGLNAAHNSVDFGILFLSLSFFVIASGVLLTILLHVLNTESRKEETGVLAALGFSNKLIIRIRFFESAVITIIGGLAGAGVGIFYNFGLLAGLNSVWKDVVRVRILEIYIQPETFITGAVGGMFISMIAIFIITRRKLKLPVVGLLRNVQIFTPSRIKRNKILNTLLTLIGFAGAVSLVIYSLITSVDKNVGLFLSAGGLFLIACVGLLHTYFSSKEKHLPVSFGILHLALKNTRRNKARNVMTIALLALGTFTIIITGANRQTLYGVGNSRSSGTGGFLFWAETTLPVLYNLNTPEGKKETGLADEDILHNVDFLQLNSLDGDDASCLNLNQVAQPRILGVDPVELNNRHAFSFKKLVSNADKDNPWLELKRSYGKDIIPAIADQTVITWGLKKKIGDTLIYLDEQGNRIKLLLIAGLNNSVFQGNVLISDENFRLHFPSAAGSKIMLVDAPSSEGNQLSDLLQSRLVDYGLKITPCSGRLAEFNSVTNTYLSVFMALGGLGVLIGTLGLGIVLLRNMMERKQEMALLIALGYTHKYVMRMVFTENLFLLVTGLVCGLLAAIIGILPSLISPAFTIPGQFIFWLITIIFISGIVWIYFPAKQIINSKLIVALRNE